jgi:hypothetical protein
VSPPPADKRIFRVTFSSGRVRYGSKQGLGRLLASGEGTPSLGEILKVEAIPDTVEWADVTSEFYPRKDVFDGYADPDEVQKIMQAWMAKHRKAAKNNGL